MELGDIRIVQRRFERRRGESHPIVWSIFLPTLLALPARVAWQFMPNTAWAGVFWLLIVADEPFRFVRRTLLGRLCSAPLYLGIAANALVTLANGGTMPVKGKEEAFSLWVPVTGQHHFAWLGDNYAGFSLGDMSIGLAALCFLSLHIATGLAESTERKKQVGMPRARSWNA